MAERPAEALPPWLPPWRELAAATAILAVLLTVVLFAGPGSFWHHHLGDCRYGAYQGTLWNYWYVGEHLLQPSQLLRSDLQYFPFGTNVYVRIGNLLDIVLYQPFAWVLPEVPARNAFVTAILLVDALAMFVAARRLSGQAGPALAAAVLFTLSRYLFEELFYGRSTNLLVFPIPLFLVAWHDAALRGGMRRVVVAAGLLALAGLSYIYYGVFLGIAVLVLAPVYVAQLGWRVGVRRHLPGIALLFGITTLLVVPAAWPFFDPQLRGVLGELTLFDGGGIAGPQSSEPGQQAWFWTVVFRHSLALGEAVRLLGVLPLLALGLVGLRAARRPMIPFLVVGAVGFVLALGPYLIPSEASRSVFNTRWDEIRVVPLPWLLLVRYMPFMDRFGHPERFIVLAQAGLLLAGAAGARAVTLRRARGPLLLALGLVALACVDTLGINRFAVHHSDPPQHSEFFHSLEGRDSTVLVSLPLEASPFLCDHQRIHRLPMLNGYGSYFRIEVVDRAAWQRLNEHNTVMRYLKGLVEDADLQPLPRPEDWAFFRRHHVQYAVLHRDVFGDTGLRYDRGRVLTAQDLSPDAFGRCRSALERLVGPAVFQDDQVVVFDLRRAWDEVGSAQGGDQGPAAGLGQRQR